MPAGVGGARVGTAGVPMYSVLPQPDSVIAAAITMHNNRRVLIGRLFFAQALISGRLFFAQALISGTR
jgi:hypothetical protein